MEEDVPRFVMATPAGYGQVTMVELDGEDEDEEDESMEEEDPLSVHDDQDRSNVMREQYANCVVLNV